MGKWFYQKMALWWRNLIHIKLYLISFWLIRQKFNDFLKIYHCLYQYIIFKNYDQSFFILDWKSSRHNSTRKSVSNIFIIWHFLKTSQEKGIQQVVPFKLIYYVVIDNLSEEQQRDLHSLKAKFDAGIQKKLNDAFLLFYKNITANCLFKQIIDRRRSRTVTSSCSSSIQCNERRVQASKG